LSLLEKQGWKPKRTIKLALWDGEEFGLIGSTEWVEKHATELSKSGAVYLNTDSSGTGMMGTGGSTSLEKFLDEVLRDVVDPRSGRSILDTLNPAPQGQPAIDAPLGALGSGSDYVAFLHHLGIASLNLGFGAPPGQYHSAYDTVRFFNRFGDTDRRFGVALTQVMTTALLRLADADVLPFAFESLRQSLTRQIDELYNMAPPGVEMLSHDALIASVRRLAEASRDFEAAYAEAVERGGVPAAVNDEVAHIERAFLTTDGLPNRDWYKHQLYAPGLLTGYAAKTLPGIREAVEAKDWAGAGKQAQRLVETLDTAAKQIETASKHLRENPRETR
jgi:N-acetylated-alpha-linked acidic dipeptidase